MDCAQDSIFGALIAGGGVIATLSAMLPATSLAQNVSLPSNITVSIQKPTTDVKPELAMFVGKWGGYWGGQLESNLYVESVSATGEARGVYAWGQGRGFGPGATKFRGKIENGSLSWGNPTRGISFEFKSLPDGRLHGFRYNDGGQDGEVTMRRME